MHKVSILLFLLLFIGLGSYHCVYAAPHVSGRPDPAISSVGHLREPSAAQTRAAALTAAPSSLRVLFLRVDFPADDNPTTTGFGEWNDPEYAYEGDSDYWVNKNRVELATYYQEVSRGKLILDIDISDQVFRLPQQMAFYGDETSAATESLIFDAVTTAQNFGADLSGYDCLLIVHAGAGEETDTANNYFGDTHGDIWSLYYADTMITAEDSGYNVLRIDGIPVTEAVLMPQTGAQDERVYDPLGVYAHEIGHFLGLPDLYPTSWFASSVGIGSWGLMGDGLYNQASVDTPAGSSPAWPSAWCRVYLSWEVPESPAANSDPWATVFQPIQGAAPFVSGVRIMQLPTFFGAQSSYYLLENRQQYGFDAGLEGHGLLIWRIDEAVIFSNLSRNTVNNYGPQSGVVLVEADGDASLMVPTGFADSGDPFPGQAGTEFFTPTSLPVASDVAGGAAWINLKNIRENAESVTVEVGLGPEPVSGAGLTFSPETVELTWDPSNDPAVAAYNVYRDGVFLDSTSEPYFADHEGADGASYWVSSVDYAGNETLDKTPVELVVIAESSDGGRCFIATAAYGSYEAPAVKQLRLFRDQILQKSAVGKLFVQTYYKLSPPLAKVISESDLLKGVVRVVLIPFICLALFCVGLSTVQQFVVIFLLVSATVLGLKTRRRRFN